MPTQKEILASIDARLTLLPQLAADVKKLLPAQPGPQPAPQPDPQPQPTPIPTPQPVPAGGMSAAQMIAANLVLPYGDAVHPKTAAVYKYAPGAWTELGLSEYWPSTGEHPDIGLVTDETAEALAGTGPLSNMIEQAKATRTLPIFVKIDGRFVDILKYPKASFDWRESPSPLFPWNISVTPDRDHAPALPNYEAFLHTGDLQYLENLQAYASFLLMLTPNSYAQGKGIIYPWQTRGVAWPLREVMKAVIATEIAEQRNGGPLPAPFLPASYWRTIANNNLDWFKTRILAGWNFDDPGVAASKRALVNGAGIVCAVTSRDGNIAVFQQDYLLLIIGWAVRTGRFPEWRAPVYDVMVKQVLARGAAPIRSEACQYWLDCKGATGWAGLLSVNGKTGKSGDIPPFMVTNSPHYIGSFRQNAALAVLNGVAGAREVYDWADNQARTVAKQVCSRHAVKLSA